MLTAAINSSLLLNVSFTCIKNRYVTQSPAIQRNSHFTSLADSWKSDGDAPAVVVGVNITLTVTVIEANTCPDVFSVSEGLMNKYPHDPPLIEFLLAQPIRA